ncbi:MAG: recombination protein RecR [Candidatus Nealsonbacteria bacterium]|nr:recombination protein RecR [Candidatus Nealsonbacteria bacterium]
MYPPAIKKLIAHFSEFPTIGPRTAARFVFYLLKTSDEEVKKLAESLLQMKERVKLCSFCFNPFEPFDAAQDKPSKHQEWLCEICRNPGREKRVICVVEKESDLAALENTKQYKGRYFILGGTVQKLKQEDLEMLRTKELAERVKGPEIIEIILATNSTPEGENTALYVERKLEGLGKKITRLGRGLPIGGELEYADPETLKSSLDNRK